MNHNPDIAFLASLLGRPAESATPTPATIAMTTRGDDGYYDQPSIFSDQLDNAIEDAAAGYSPAFQAWLNSIK